MCDLGKISDLIIAAQTASLLIIVTLAIAIANSASFFAAAANVPVMVVLIGTAAVATGLLSAAWGELGKCLGGPCDEALTLLNITLGILSVNMGIFTGILLATAIVAAIPFAGAVAAGVALTYAIAFSGFLEGAVFGVLAIAAGIFNDCQAKNAAPGRLSPAISVLGVVIFLAIVLLIGISWDAPTPPTPPTAPPSTDQ